MNSSYKIFDKFYSKNEKIAQNGAKHYLSSTSLRKDEAIALHNMILKYKPIKTLEIGLALGASALAIASAKIFYTKNSHIALDPFQDRADFLGLTEIESFGLQNLVDHHSAFSEIFLNQAYAENSFFDFVFIDGNHTIGQAVTDVFLSDKVLNIGGIIAIHDSMLFSTAASIKYLVLEQGYEVIDQNCRNFKTVGRQIKYLSKLGIWYSKNIIPKLSNSVVFLRKR